MTCETRILKTSFQHNGFDGVRQDIVDNVLSQIGDTVGDEVTMRDGSYFMKLDLDLNQVPKELVEAVGEEGLQVPVTIDMSEGLHRDYQGLKTKPLYIVKEYGEVPKVKLVHLKVRNATEEEREEFRTSDTKKVTAYCSTFDTPYVIEAGSFFEYYDDNFCEHEFTVTKDTRVPLHYTVYTHVYMDEDAEELILTDTIIHTHSLVAYLI